MKPLLMKTSFIAITAILATPALWASDTLVAGQAGGVGLYFNGARQHAKFACPMIPGLELSADHRPGRLRGVAVEVKLLPQFSEHSGKEVKS
jgi:hypothetical protein